MSGRLLQVLPSVLREVDGDLQIEEDFCESVRVSLDKFDRVSVACPVTKEVGDAGLRRCIPIDELPRDRVTFIPLPNAYGLVDFVRHYSAVRRLLRSEIEKSEYLVLSPHTLVGDWPTVAAREAIRLNRPYTIEADVVYESLAQAEGDRAAGWKRIIKGQVLLPLFLRSYRNCLSNTELALFQGRDVYDAYAPFCSNPHKVYHHIPIYSGDHITDDELRKKFSRLEAGEPLKICYAGRAIDMKGPMEWIDTLNELILNGVKLHGTWIGDGTLLSSMKAKVNDLKVADYFSFPGFVLDQQKVLQAMKDSDIFLYCHKTQESARCLGEALACGCPIIGFASAYPVELVERHGGGLFAGQGDWGELAEQIQHLNKNRGQLQKLIGEATATGRYYDRDALLRDRMDLIRKFGGRKSNPDDRHTLLQSGANA